MKVAFFNSKDYDLEYFDRENQIHQHQIRYFSPHLTLQSVALITDELAVCVFINDCLDGAVLLALKHKGVKLIALRSAGFNHVDLPTATKLGLVVVRVPAYSPYAVAEHAVGLLQCLNRGIHRAHNRVREGDFSLRNLIGFDLHDKTVGIIGTGKIGQVFSQIMQGFGCKVIAYDPVPAPRCLAAKVQYLPLGDVFRLADIISLHCPLTPETEHLINTQTLDVMKDQVTIINTSRGRLIDTKAIITGLKTAKVGLLGLDVYEEEESIFFEDLSNTVIQDDVFSRLLTFPNVLITSHQGFFTKEALQQIAAVTLHNITKYEHQGVVDNGVTEP